MGYRGVTKVLHVSFRGVILVLQGVSRGVAWLSH